ncbi:MAG: hypothetical protein ACTSXD_13745 [Candidatus Heimdallarchaeaceae archaeon]
MVVLDYIAYWDAERQEQYGSARGWIEQEHQPYIVTGPFNLESYHPYFVSPTLSTQDRYTWTGKIPERVVFEFEYGPENSDHENYIVLPLDTQIKMASQLCDESISGVPIDLETTINWWNPETQMEVMSEGKCSEILIPNSPYDFKLEPGKVYKIIVTEDATWEQK